MIDMSHFEDKESDDIIKIPKVRTKAGFCREILLPKPCLGLCCNFLERSLPNNVPWPSTITTIVLNTVVRNPIVGNEWIRLKGTAHTLNKVNSLKDGE